MEFLMPTLINIFTPVLGALVSWGVYEGTKYVRTKTKNESVAAAVGHVGKLVDTTVKDLEQTMVPALKDAVADGNLSVDDRKKLKATAVHRVKKQLPATVATTARLAVNSLTDYIGARVEKAVLDGKG